MSHKATWYQNFHFGEGLWAVTVSLSVKTNLAYSGYRQRLIFSREIGSCKARFKHSKFPFSPEEKHYREAQIWEMLQIISQPRCLSVHMRGSPANNIKTTASSPELDKKKGNSNTCRNHCNWLNIKPCVHYMNISFMLLTELIKKNQNCYSPEKIKRKTGRLKFSEKK